MAPATVNNHLAHLSALFSWITVHAPAGLLRHGNPTKKVEPQQPPAPQARALAGPQVRTVKNVLDRIEGFPKLNGRRHRGGAAVAVHRHSRPLRDRAIVHLILGTGLRRVEVTGLDLDQLDPADPSELRRVKKGSPRGSRSAQGRVSRVLRGKVGHGPFDAGPDFGAAGGAGRPIMTGGPCVSLPRMRRAEGRLGATRPPGGVADAHAGDGADLLIGGLLPGAHERQDRLRLGAGVRDAFLAASTRSQSSRPRGASSRGTGPRRLRPRSPGSG